MNKLLNQFLQKKIASNRKPYGHSLPDFAEELTTNFDLIKQEWDNYRKHTNSMGVSIDNVSKEQAHLNEDKRWKSLFLFGYTYYNFSLAKNFPFLFKFIHKWERHINLMMFSTTEAGKHIPAHEGNNHGVLRLQLGIDIEFPEQCLLRVEDKKFFLKEKELIVFDDTFEHELENRSASHRTVLIIDFFKPLPFFYNAINRRKIRAMRKSDYIQSVIKKLN